MIVIKYLRMFYLVFILKVDDGLMLIENGFGFYIGLEMLKVLRNDGEIVFFEKIDVMIIVYIVWFI